ncbi:uncharacterized protein LOC118368741 isoform X3 [Oncorhynchus keta]|uniref:uncharacterized protein LOC118368741 isoform X3 n=1 Tax=Oncorhynchus keta TaxID=8018 RepID=UPI00227B2A83|nr:uncharacterized protein LOC118368741 isoform X3 [Oncorhynchus keta]
MSSLSSCPDKEEGVCWTEKEGLWLNIVVKEEEEDEAVTVKKEVEGEAVAIKGEGAQVKEEFRVKDEDVVTVKEEGEEKVEGAVFGVKEEITVTVKEEETGDQINNGQPPGGDSSRPGDRRSIHPELMAPSAGCARSRRAPGPGLIGADWGLVRNQGLIAHPAVQVP